LRLAVQPSRERPREPGSDVPEKVGRRKPLRRGGFTDG
jgi:hypothetical protein